MNEQITNLLEDKEIDPLVLVLSRNNFYKARMYFVFLLLLLSLVGVCILAGITVFLIKHPTQPVYFPADKAGRLIKEVPLSQANMSDEAVGDWVTKAVVAAYSYDFVNYRSQLQSAQQYFFDSGWRELMAGLNSSGNLIGLTERNLIFQGKAAALPKLVGKGLYKNSILYWKFEIPVLISFYKPPSYESDAKSENPWLVTVLVFRRSILESRDGLGIVQMNGTSLGA